MTRGHRLLMTAAIIAGAIGAVWVLTALSTVSTGPITTGLERVATTVGSLEHEARDRVSGRSRAAGPLRWFDRYRASPALLRAPDSVLLGAYDSGLPATLDGITALEQSVGVTLPLVQIYTAWGDHADEQFPAQLVTAIWDFGSVPLITWEPWLDDFESAQHPQIALRDVRDRHGLAAVARGDYDFYIDAWAAAAVRFGHPFFVRFGHEMNDPYRYPWGPQNDTKEEYIAAWRHVVDRARHDGATNIVWVWSPHVAYRYWELYYPGDAYVDWVATGALNFGPIAQWSRWWSFAEIFGKQYTALAAFKKPVMVAEMGSLGVGGDRAAWYRDALSALPRRYPAVRALLFFNASNDRTVTYQTLDWSVTDDTAAAGAIRAAVRPWAPGPKSAPRATP